LLSVKGPKWFYVVARMADSELTGPPSNYAKHLVWVLKQDASGRRLPQFINKFDARHAKLAGNKRQYVFARLSCRYDMDRVQDHIQHVEQSSECRYNFDFRIQFTGRETKDGNPPLILRPGLDYRVTITGELRGQRTSPTRFTSGDFNVDTSGVDFRPANKLFALDDGSKDSLPKVKANTVSAGFKLANDLRKVVHFEFSVMPNWVGLKYEYEKKELTQEELDALLKQGG